MTHWETFTDVGLVDLNLPVKITSESTIHMRLLALLSYFLDCKEKVGRIHAGYHTVCLCF